MKCTEECLRIIAQAEAQRAAWAARWPSYCRECDGWGGHRYAVNLDEPPSVEPCEGCAGRGRCGRCWALGLTEDGAGPCAACGWDYSDGLPPLVECYCWAEEVEA